MSLHIVMTGYDHTVFEDQSASNTEQRLLGYASILASKHSGARLTYLALRAPLNAKKFTKQNVDFIPIHCGSLSLFYHLPRHLSALKDVSFIFSQTPYEDGFSSLIFAKLKGIAYGVQIHNDPQNIPGIWPLRLLRKAMSLCCYSTAKLIRVVNPIIANQFKELYGDKVRTIPVAPSLIPSQRTSLPQTPHILIVSRLSREKGIDIALNVIAKATEKVPNLMTTIIGDGIEKASLLEQSKELGIRVDFLGTLAPQELSKYYSKSTLLLLTSREEGWGRVFIEGMMAGLPIVATATLGAKAIIFPDKNGFLSPINDIDGLSQNVTKLCFDEDLNTKMGYESYKMSEGYQSQKLDHDLIEAILSKCTMKERK